MLKNFHTRYSYDHNKNQYYGNTMNIYLNVIIIKYH